MSEETTHPADDWPDTRFVLPVRRTFFLLYLAALFSGGQRLQAQPVTFYADWFPGAQFAGIYLAIDRGYYRDAGLEVTLVPFAYGMKHPELIDQFPERCALGSMEGYIFLQNRGRGVDLIALAAQIQESPAGFMSLAKTPVLSAKDFRGKRIGVHAFADPLYRYFVARAGLKESDAEMVFVKDDVASLIRGDVQAAQGYATEEFIRLRERSSEGVHFVSFKTLGFDAYSEVLFTTRSQQTRHAETLKRFVEVTRRGWIEAFKEPSAAIGSVLSRCDPASNTTAASVKASLDALRSYVMPGGALPMRAMEVEKWQNMQRACLEMGFLPAIEPVAPWLFQEQ